MSMDYKFIEDYLFNMVDALNDARTDAPLGEDEHYESDEWYEGAIHATRELLEIAKENYK